MVNDILPFDQPPPPPSIFEASWHPCLNVDSITVFHLFLCAVFPFLSATFYLSFRLVFGTLYPAYASYKAVKTKNVKEYVKWMMYWIVFALFTCLETIADIFISFWLPFYYELKILFVLWLMSPATKGSSILYRKFVHPAFTRRERDIDDYISKAKEQGYSTVLQMGSKGFSYATSVVMQTALRGQFTFVNQLRKSYSLSDISVDNKYEHLPVVESNPIPIIDTDEEDQTGIEPSPKKAPQKRHQRLVKSMSSPEKFSEEEEDMTTQEEDDDDDHSKQRKVKHQAKRRNTTNIPLPSENKESQDSIGESSDGAIPSGSKLGRSKSLRVTSRKYTTHKEVGAYTTLPRSRLKGNTKKRPALY